MRAWKSCVHEIMFQSEIIPSFYTLIFFLRPIHYCNVIVCQIVSHVLFFLFRFFCLFTMFSWLAGCFVLASTDKSVTLMVVKSYVNKYTCFLCISQIIKLVCLIHVSVLTTHGFIIRYVVYSYFQSECI